MIGAPVAKWSDETLRRVLTVEKSPGTPLLVAALAELLYRERKRCAAALAAFSESQFADFPELEDGRCLIRLAIGVIGGLQ